MTYLFATEDRDYSDYAGGRVIYSQPGAPAFPVRLSSEIFQRALQRMPPGRRLTVYDPTCGGAYHLAALGFLHGKHIRAILASDADEQILALARRNLGLLSAPGLDRREQEIREMLKQYGKESHAEALRSIERLRQQMQPLIEQNDAIQTRVFLANALDPRSMQQGLNGEPVDLVISDIPYGLLTGWQLPQAAPDSQHSPVWRMLNALLPTLSPETILAITADKAQKVAHEGYRRVERFQVGKRQISLLKIL